MRRNTTTTPILDGALAVGLGAFCAVLVVVLPPLIAAGLALPLVGLAATRFDVGAIASSLVLVTAFTMPMNRLFIGVPVPLSDFFLIATAGVYILIRLTERSSPAERTYKSVAIGLGLLALGGLVGAVFEAPGPFLYKALGVPIRDISGWSENLGNLMKFVLGSLLPIGVWALVRPSRAFVRRILWATLSGAVVSAVIGIVLPLGKVGRRSVGMTVHPNQFGSICLLAMGVAFGLLLSRRQIQAWAFFVFPLLAIGIMASGSRAALGGMLILLLMIGPLTHDRRIMGALLAGAAAILLVFATGLIKPEGENALGRTLGSSSSAVGSGQVRDDLFERVFDRWVERPFTGQGYNYMRPSHNVYLGILASAGVLGVIGFTVVAGTVIRRFWRRRDDLLIAGVTAGYIAYLANAYFDNIFWWRWLWFHVGLVLATIATYRSEESIAEGAQPDEPVETPASALEPGTAPRFALPASTR